MTKKKIITTIIIIVVLLAATGGGILYLKKSQDKAKAGAGGMGGFGGPGGWGGAPKSATAVRTIVAQKKTLTDFVYTNGEIETQKSIEVYPSMKGKVVEMKVSLGSTVKQGDVIAYIDPSEPGSYYAKSPVLAPISGSVITTPVKIGQTVSVSSVITKIGDISNLQITVKVPERYVADIALGQKAEITLQAYGEEKFYASVVRISPVVDPATRTKEVILNFDKRYDKVNAGMFARVKLFTLDYGGFPVIPQDAFVENSDEYYLFIAKEDSTVTKRKIRRGKNIDGSFQVVEGLEEGEIVIVEGMLSLYEGAKIKDISGNVVVQEAPAGGEGFDGKNAPGVLPEGTKK